MKEMVVRVIRFIVILLILSIITYKIGYKLGEYTAVILSKYRYNVLIFR